MSDVSVIIPCYNAERYIGQTIESVLGQTDAPRQVIVIDDGSTDRSASIVRRYAGDVVELVEQDNHGESHARNVGIEKATCLFVALLDADDIWLPQKTARQLQALAQFPDAVGVHSRVLNFKVQIDDCGREETERSKDDPSVEDLLAYHYVTPSALMVRREVLVERGIRFDETVRHSEDMLFAAELRLAGPLRLVDEPLVAKRVHGEQQSADPWHTIWSLRSRVNWCRRHCDAIGAGAMGAERAAALDEQMGLGMVDFLERCYWQRQIEGLAAARAAVAELFPDLIRQSKVLSRRIYPPWFYRLRDWFGPRRR